MNAAGFAVPPEDRHFEDYVVGSVHEFRAAAVMTTVAITLICRRPARPGP